MMVYVFGNWFFLVVVMYGFCRVVLMVEFIFGKDVIDFVVNNFYVDDGFVFVFVLLEVIDFMKRM